MLTIFSDVEPYQVYSTIKGTFFIIISAIIIYFLVHHEIVLLKEAQLSYRAMSRHDALTTLYNRTVFSEDLDTYNNTQHEYTLVVTDINGLRLINEAYGSTIGDEVIQTYAAQLKNISYPSSTYRIGGDEFCIVFDGRDLTKINNQLDKIKTAMESTTKYRINVTLSTGIATKSEYSSIYEALTHAEEMLLKNKLLQSTSASNALITSLLSTLYEHSDETELHAQRISELCEQMAIALHMDRAAIDEMILFALLHDIGKVGIEDHILRKSGSLTPLEYAKIKQHSAIGYRIAKSTAQLQSIANYIFTHHERWDGQGYPRGIAKKDIPIQSRILAIADAFDAMTNDRIYRKAISKEEALEEIIRNKGLQFDPELVDIFTTIQGNISSQD
ncbi:diguanylate cyclase [Candidatus Xianfuyuplasma coldseepsis]|uniref:Diguanylate cyclase n=1 Tax=Candidatus Xianfuyuplasma coldseepsis TaxID=2782163 RepID=A0A7L7KSU0_9MOLU|nr:diguanylate cyclase [Xianfuyuplasma coldseepsis]QMS85296.1 diguanylate cyclase [Xianfuyuplasma coldseepsis]